MDYKSYYISPLYIVIMVLIVDRKTKHVAHVWKNSLFGKKIQFETDFDPSKCLKQIRLSISLRALFLSNHLISVYHDRHGWLDMSQSCDTFVNTTVLYTYWSVAVQDILLHKYVSKFLLIILKNLCSCLSICLNPMATNLLFQCNLSFLLYPLKPINVAILLKVKFWGLFSHELRR